MTLIYFIVGTDTAVGKTVVASLLLKKLSERHFRTLGVKPVASGLVNGRSEDALMLAECASIKLPYKFVNPYRFSLPIAPHIAALKNGIDLSVEKLMAACHPALSCDADVIVIEGAGGWLTPLNQKETMADFVVSLACPVILVVGLRLGCLNHAMLTYESIRARGVEIAAVVINVIDKYMLNREENIAYLRLFFSFVPVFEVGSIDLSTIDYSV